MPSFYQKLTQGVLVAGCIIAAAPPAWATSFTINSGETVTTLQTLVDNETGLIVSGGFLNVTSAAAVQLSGDNTTITNNGTINVTGASVEAILQGGNATIINNGTINADSLLAGDDVGTQATLFLSGANNVVINNGSINTSGKQSDAVDNRGDFLIFTNNGSITTTGVSSEAFFVRGDNSVYNNLGLIDTLGDNSDGILSSGDNDVFNNSGTIITRGDSAAGIFYNGTSATITNSGTIRTKGTSSAGVLSNGSVTINNSGLISADESATQSINGSNNADTLNLLSGSQIIGIIDLDGGTDIVNISGANNSSTLTLTDVETINLLNGNALLVGDVATVVDPTGQSVSSAVLSSTTLAVHNVVNQRLAHNEVLKPIQVATSELTSGMVFQKRAPQIWGSALGEMRERDLEGIALGYDHNYVGFTGGYEASFYKARIGLLGGFVRSTVKTTGDKFGRVRSVDTDTDSFFVGAYSQYFLGGINLTTTLMAGYEDHENDRAVVDNLNGFETAQADFSSFFISPSLTVSSAYRVGTEVELRPSVTFAYSGGWYDDYAESGTTRSDLVIDDRNAHALTGQLQLAAAYSLAEENELEFRAGAKARYTDNDDIDVSLAGTDFRIPNASDSSVYGGYVGMNLRVAIKESINLVADIEHGRAGGGEEHIAAMLKLEWVFN
jgi:outer membrane autotransporter protein